VLVVLLAVALQVPSQDAFQIRTDIQGLYDEMAQATLQFDSPLDIDEFHSVLLTPNWTVVDDKGVRHPWSELRDKEIAELNQPRPDSIKHIIQKVSLAQNAATVTVVVETVRTITDTAGKYGRAGATHVLTEDVPYRDSWVYTDAKWRLNLREQVGSPKLWVDKPFSDTL